MTALQRRRIAWILEGYLEDNDPDTFEERAERQLAHLNTPQEWFLWASHSHPAQSVAEWRRVLDSSLCDAGTALLVFWRNSPVYYYGDEPAGGWDFHREGYELVREIAHRYAAGGYPSAIVRFDPAAFKGSSFLNGYTAAELERVPAHMRRPSSGEPVPQLTAEDFEWGDGF